MRCKDKCIHLTIIAFMPFQWIEGVLPEHVLCTIASKINGTPKWCLLAHFEATLDAILAVANLLAHNNKCQICYCGQISLQMLQLTADLPTPLGLAFILLAMLQ